MIRNMKVGEILPVGLQTGFEKGKCDPEWMFIAERDGVAVALLVTAPAHIAVILLRLISTPEADVSDVRSLLVYVVKTIKERGYMGYMTWVDPTQETERTLIGIIKAAGGVQLTTPHVVCAGKV